MQLTVRISCERVPADLGYANHGNNAIELASALRQLAGLVEASADVLAEGHEYIIRDAHERYIGRAAYRMVELP